jgi:acetyl-CoA C-acetyltransferase
VAAGSVGIIGAGAITQRDDDPESLDELNLMAAAVRAAERDADRSLASDVDVIMVPQGSWPHANPAGALGALVGADHARTVLAQIGVLQSTMVGRAVELVASGSARSVLVAGGEARSRQRRAALGAGASIARDADGTWPAPDETWSPSADILSPVEIERGLVVPAAQYALLDSAMRIAAGQSLGEHRRDVARLWARSSEIAADNPLAWSRQPRSVEDIDLPSATNRPMAYPYNKWHCSQWNVDQAAALFIGSLPDGSGVHIRSVTESNVMVPVVERDRLDQSPGFAAAWAEASAGSGLDIDEIDLIELYSCFPAAVRIQAAELAVPSGRDVTVTGGMTFGGGPLNNFVLQALAAVSAAIRAGRGRTALVTSVSGMLTKQGCVVLADHAGPAARLIDVSDQVTPSRRVVSDAVRGPATVVSYTVAYEQLAATSVTAIVEDDAGQRTVAVSHDADLAARVVIEELGGATVSVTGDAFTV